MEMLFEKLIDRPTGNGGSENRVILDERNFRTLDPFDGDVGKFRGWRFDLMVAMSQVNPKLGSELDRWLKGFD